MSVARDILKNLDDEEERRWRLYDQASDNLLPYIQLTFPLTKATAYKPNWHQIVMIDYIERTINGEFDHLMILVPYRHGKSTVSSYSAPSWFLGQYPDKNVMIGSYNSTFARDFGKRNLDTVRTDMYHYIFPDLILDPDQQTQTWWKTTKDGSLQSQGRGGSFQGSGAHLGFLDDLIKNREEARSEAYRERVWDFYTGTFYNRLEWGQGASLILINTRQHDDDIVGRIIREEGEKWTVIRMPAIAERDETWELKDGTKFTRKEGEPLWEDRFPLDVLMQIKESSGMFWYPNYQQRTAPEEGNIFSKKDFNEYDNLPSEKPLRIVLSGDTAWSSSDKSDYTVFGIWFVYSHGWYLVHMTRERWTMPENKQGFLNLVENYDLSRAIIEDFEASGNALLQDIETDEDISVPCKVVGFKQYMKDNGASVTGDKVARAESISGYAKSGKIFIPRGAGWKEDFYYETTHFPNAVHDDIVDMVSQMLITETKTKPKRAGSLFG